MIFIIQFTNQPPHLPINELKVLQECQHIYFSILQDTVLLFMYNLNYHALNIELQDKLFQGPKISK